jgi:light-regulated signal transduction histidine kinase (bacteriophytochrome)
VRQCVSTGQTYHIEEEYPNPEGEPRQYQRSFSPIKDFRGNVVQVVSWSTDITEQKRNEAALRHAHDYLEARVRDRTRELEAFAYSVSHDLRAPLRAINGFAEILNWTYRDTFDEEGKRYLDNVIEASLHMDQLILGLLSYSRLGRTALHPGPVALGQVFSQVNDTLSTKVLKLKAEIVLPPALPAVYGDATLVKQLFLNLVDNALLYHRPGVPPRVEITCAAQETMIEVGVSDNGIGIPPAYQDKIFRVFQRLHSPDDIPGTGIGLAIVEKCVSLMGGALRLRSKPGQGSTFYITLPGAEP